MSPIADEMFRSIPVSHNSRSAPPTRERRGQQNQNRRQPGAELDDQDCKHQNHGEGEYQQQLAEGLTLRLVLSANLVGVADRQLELVEM